MPEHVQQLETGGTVCKHCGGSVDPDGYAMGGEIAEAETRLSDAGTPAETPQFEATAGLRRSAFADAMSKRGGD